MGPRKPSGDPGRLALRAVVAMPAGEARRAVVAAVAAEGMAVEAPEARGDALLTLVVGQEPALLVVELSRLGRAGLPALVATAARAPTTVVVLLVPEGLRAPGASALGITAVLDEWDVAGVRTLARWRAVASDGVGAPEDQPA